MGEVGSGRAPAPLAWPRCVPSLPRLNRNCLPETPLSAVAQQPAELAWAAGNPPLQPGALRLPAKVTEQERTPLPPREMLGKDEPKSPREPPPPHSDPYGCGGHSAGSPPGLAPAWRCLLPAPPPRRSAPKSPHGSAPPQPLPRFCPVSRESTHGPQAAPGLPSPQHFARPPPHSYSPRPSGRGSPAHVLRKDSAGKGLRRVLLRLVARRTALPAGAAGTRWVRCPRHLRACGPLPPGKGAGRTGRLRSRSSSRPPCCGRQRGDRPSRPAAEEGRQG